MIVLRTTTSLIPDVTSVLKLLLLPVRLCVGWEFSPRLLGLLGATMLVILRVTIGFHFYTEGTEKRISGNWTAKPFFANAKGPFAADYQAMVWDWDGSYRLTRQFMLVRFAQFRNQVATNYGFTEGQKAKAQANYARAVELYDWVIESNASDLEEFEKGRDWMKGLSERTSVNDIPAGVGSLGGQRGTLIRDWQSKGASALGEIDKIWENYEADQNRLATPEQMQASGYLEMIRPRTGAFIDTSEIDRIVPYFDIAIGLCLLLGLFTPVAALAAAGFLGSVFLSQLPPASGPGSTYYQLIESMACLVLAGTAAGRFAGLDYFIQLFIRRVSGEDSAAT
ncbi:MAG: DoxX family protein [Rubripirellula sp.]